MTCKEPKQIKWSKESTWWLFKEKNQFSTFLINVYNQQDATINRRGYFFINMYNYTIILSR